MRLWVVAFGSSSFWYYFLGVAWGTHVLWVLWVLCVFGRWSLALMLGSQVHWSRKAHGNGNASDCLCVVGDCTPGLVWKKLDVSLMSLMYLVSLVSMVILVTTGVGCGCELVFSGEARWGSQGSKGGSGAFDKIVKKTLKSRFFF